MDDLDALASDMPAALAPAAPRRSTSVWLIILSSAWLALVVGALGVMAANSFAPGAEASAPPAWPAGASLPAPHGQPTLVAVVHPQCSCTRASLAEASRLMSRIGGQVNAYMLFVKPDGAGAAWERTDLYRRAQEIEGITLVTDEGGREATRFGAATSGQMYLYRADGTLAFHGGITPSRGHEGDNVGRERILALVEGRAVDRNESSVYGCAIDEAGARNDPWFSMLPFGGRIGERNIPSGER